MIELQNVTKYFGAHCAVEDVTFFVPAGQIVGFLGPNGAGKSTTMRILTGFLAATSGYARVDGFEVHADPIEVKRRIGYLPERVPLYEEMTVTAFLTFVGQIKGLSAASAKDDVKRVLEQCGLSTMAHRIIRNLSKGYRQRVGIAQALIANPPVLILDEPTVGLDPKQVVEIRMLIRSLAPQHTVLLSTHILPEVTMICERALIIHRGRLAADVPLHSSDGGGDVEARHLEKIFLDVVSGGSNETAENALRTESSGRL